MKVIYSSFKIKEFALNVFKELYSYDQFKALETYVVEKVASDGATQFSLKDRNDSIQGCFLSPYAIVQKRNNPRQRWFEDKGFSIKNTEVFLSDQWYGDDRHNSTAILPLQYFVEMSYRNIYKIQNNSGEFKLIKTGDSMNNQEPIKVVSKNAYQAIFFGAPGTGKSYKVNSILGEERKKFFVESSEIVKSSHYADVLSKKEYIDCNIWIIDNIGTLEKKLAEFAPDDKRANPRHSALQAYIDFLKKYREENRELRTTFHPDYDYAQFVGAYKPKKESEKITYSFVPQVFAKAYAAAWKLQLTGAAEANVFLVIEEINRGNCAQIFGDIFQLLDRDSEGFSQYSIDADNDFATWLKEESVLKDVWSGYVDKVGEGKLKLPPNLNILATMNTSDQSLFPMDSAFKRRFDWEYVPISFDGKEAAKYEIDVRDSKGNRYLWKDFVENVNKRILDLTESEDKQLGEFFIKPDDGMVISKERFLGKVMFYLWNEVCKDEHKNGSFFQAKDESGKVNYFTFQNLYRDESLLKRFMDELLKKDT
jgi:hypothetical protein